MRRAPNQGFTLVELMVTIAIVAILLAIALPSFEGSMRSNRVATANNELLASLALARTEAIRSTRPAGLCAANADGTACVDATEWTDGWLVWANTNDDDNYQNGTDTLVRYVQARQGIELTVPASGAAAPGLNTRILFDSRGRAMDAPADGRVIVMQPTDCPDGMELRRELALMRVGQVNSTKEACQ